jgi:hypothetical protein
LILENVPCLENMTSTSYYSITTLTYYYNVIAGVYST